MDTDRRPSATPTQTPVQTPRSVEKTRRQSQVTQESGDGSPRSRPQSRMQTPLTQLSRVREDANAYKFEPTTKSWRGPVMASMALMKHTKRIRSKLRQLDLQKKQESALKVKKSKESSDDPVREVDLSGSEDEGDGRDSPDADTIMAELPIIMPPFHKRPVSRTYTPWRAPPVLESDRNKNFDFERIRGNATNCSFISPRQQLLRLSDDMAQRDGENEMLRKQLNKAQQENYRLLQELQGYKGKHYEELVKENAELKVCVDRVHRDNIRLQGERRKDDNTVLRRIFAETQLAAIRTKQFHGAQSTQLPAV